MEFLLYKERLFIIDDCVQKPDRYSFFLEENTIINPGEMVLDLTTGSGFHAIMIATIAAQVVAVDILPSAIECARRNVQINKLDDKIQIREGDLYKVLGAEEKFNLIIAWPPLFPTPPNKHRIDWVGVSTEGGIDGRHIIDQIIMNAPKHLYRNGRLQILHAWYNNFKKSLEMLNTLGFRAEITAECYFPIGNLSFERADYLKELGYPLIEKDGELLQHHAIITGWFL